MVREQEYVNYEDQENIQPNTLFTPNHKRRLDDNFNQLNIEDIVSSSKKKKSRKIKSPKNKKNIMLNYRGSWHTSTLNESSKKKKNKK